jgi:Zn ribbon nucleic-acid-binding protein
MSFDKGKSKALRDMRSGERMTPCVCPRCNTQHRLKMRWIGRGVPRKFCHACVRAIDTGLVNDIESNRAFGYREYAIQPSQMTIIPTPGGGSRS